MSGSWEQAGYESMAWKDLGQATEGIDRVKTVEHETPLADADGAVLFVIACPDDPAYFDLGYALQEAILGPLSGPVRVKVPDAVTDQERQQGAVIALGNLGNNALLTRLYHSYYVAVDHAYPGQGGHVLQTVHDPWGYGTNVIVCGGSSLDGVRTAVKHAIASVAGDQDRKWFPRLCDIVVGSDFRARYPAVSFECTPEHRQHMIAHTYERLAQGMHRGATPPVSHAGLMYHLTGDDRFAELYRDLFKIMYQSAANDPGTGPWSPWGFDADFQSATMLGAWDVVEESLAFSDEDRLYMTNHLLWYVRYMAEHAKNHRPARLRSPRHNHYTFAALGLLYGAKYFRKYYHLAEAEEWLALADECFQTQATAFKANEDCNSYQWLTFYHTLRYALVRPDPAFIASGNARLCLDLGIATMDNLGYQVPYGDVREYRGTFSEVPFFKATASLLKDPAYQPVIDTKNRIKPPYDPDAIEPVGYQYDLSLGEGRAPKSFMDVSALPVEPLYFEHFHGPAQIDYERSFDKIVFRHSLDPADDYLLLDGLSNGGHLHRDGNSLVRYTSKGRIWLADADYLKAPQKFHNSVLVFKEGRGALIPDYTELGAATWVAPFGYSESTIRNYAGTDWTRHILELQGRYFVAMDEIVARESGEFDFRCLWRTIGDVSLDEENMTFAVQQGGPRMDLACAPGFAAPVEMVLKQEPMIWGTWDQYPYHGQSADVKVLQERASATLKSGSRYVYFNLFGTQGPYPRLERLAECLAYLEGPEAALVGTGAGLTVVQRDLKTDASFVYLSGALIFLVDVSSLTLSGARLHCSGPATLMLDLQQGMVRSAESIELALTDAATAHVTADPEGQALPELWRSAAQEAMVAAIRSASALPRRDTKDRRSSVGAGPPVLRGERPVWEVSLPDKPRAVCLDRSSAQDPPLYVGGESGSLYRLEGGQISWRFEAQGRANSVAVSDVTGDGRAEVILGSADHHVYLFDGGGHEIWRRELPFYMHDPSVEVVTTADLGLPKGHAVIAGSNNCHVHAFSPDGDELWRCEVIHGVNDVTAADITGDGIHEVLAVTEWWTWHCINAVGKGLWPVWSVRSHYAPGANAVRAADVNGDGKLEMVCGAIDSCVYAFDRAGARLWEFFTGEEISALQCVDLSGDGLAEIVAGAMNGYLYAISGQGDEIWHCRLGEEVNSLVILPSPAGPQLVVGTDGPLAFVLSAEGSILTSVDTGSPLRKVTACSTTDGVRLYTVSRGGRIALYHLTV